MINMAGANALDRAKRASQPPPEPVQIMLTVR
jgi:hypothetical protein